jgi:MinD-like ATPase involved in chromosome partitioning or flagellar assembly
MPAKVFACISHKGGTGRTTTTANVAYRLALRNRSVCCVDLDLDSPTFGAVIGMRGYEQGAPVGIHDFLHDGSAPAPRSPDAALDALVDMWENSGLPHPGAGRAGRLRLLAGGRERMDYPLASVEQQGHVLGRIVGALRDEFDHVLLDVRSGVSETVEAVLAADEALQAVHWLVFFRWTPQHLSGAADLCERLGDAGADLSLVRTAFTDPADMGSWFREQHLALTRRAQSSLRGQRILTDIVSEPMLQWKEGVVTEDHLNSGVASQGIVESYERLASQMETL